MDAKVGGRKVPVGKIKFTLPIYYHHTPLIEVKQKLETYTHLFSTPHKVISSPGDGCLCRGNNNLQSRSRRFSHRSIIKSNRFPHRSAFNSGFFNRSGKTNVCSCCHSTCHRSRHAHHKNSNCWGRGCWNHHHHDGCWRRCHILNDHPHCHHCLGGEATECWGPNYVRLVPILSNIKPELQDSDPMISDLPEIETVDQTAIEEGALQVKSIKNENHIPFK